MSTNTTTLPLLPVSVTWNGDELVYTDAAGVVLRRSKHRYSYVIVSVSKPARFSNSLRAVAVDESLHDVDGAHVLRAHERACAAAWDACHGDDYAPGETWHEVFTEVMPRFLAQEAQL